MEYLLSGSVCVLKLLICPLESNALIGFFSVGVGPTASIAVVVAIELLLVGLFLCDSVC